MHVSWTLVSVNVTLFINRSCGYNQDKYLQIPYGQWWLSLKEIETWKAIRDRDTEGHLTMKAKFRVVSLQAGNVKGLLQPTESRKEVGMDSRVLLRDWGRPFQVFLMTSDSCGHFLACTWPSLCTVQDSPLRRSLLCPNFSFSEGYSHVGLEPTLIVSFYHLLKILLSNKVMCVFLRAMTSMPSGKMLLNTVGGTV